MVALYRRAASKGSPQAWKTPGHQPRWQASPDKIPMGPAGAPSLLPLSLLQEGSRGVFLWLPEQRAVPWQQGCLRKDATILPAGNAFWKGLK